MRSLLSNPPAPEQVERYNAFVLRHQWTNLWLNVFDGAVFTMGMALVPPETVLPGFIRDLADRIGGLSAYRNTLVGVLLLIISVCFMMPQQLWVARICERRAILKRPLILFGLAERIPWLAMGAMAGFVARMHPKGALYAFFAIVFVWQFTVGLVSPIWQEMVARITPVNRRGLLFGIRECLGGLLGFGVLVAARGLVPHGFPANYTTLFLGAFGLIMISWTALFFLKETPHPGERVHRSLAEHAGEAWEVLRHDRALGRYFLSRMVYGLGAVSAVSFFSMRAADVLGEAATVRIMVDMAMVIMLSRAVVAVFIGPLGDLFGYRVIMVMAGASGSGGVALALAASGAAGFYAAFALATFSAMAFWLGHSNYILELAPLEKRPTYISLDNMMGLPLVAVPFLGGWLADRFGYGLPFAIGAAAGLASAAMFLFLCVEPRKALRPDRVS